MDRVQVLKRESAALGGDAADEAPWDAPIEPQEDACEMAGVYLQDDSNRDETTLIDRSGNDMRLKDGNNPGGKTLTELAAAGSGISEATHKVLRQLIHFINDGPAEGFTSGAYKETTGTTFPSAIVWYTDSGKTDKIVERLLTWTGVNLTTDKWKIYDTDGSTVLWTVSDAISYTGVFETSRTRTITSGDA